MILIFKRKGVPGLPGTPQTLPAFPTMQPDYVAGLAGFSGFAAIPAAAIDPPHCAASPAVPALVGPGPRLGIPGLGGCSLQFGNALEFRKQILMPLSQVSNHPCISEELPEVAFGQDQIEMVYSV